MLQWPVFFNSSIEFNISALDLIEDSMLAWAVKLQKLLVFKVSLIFLHEAETTKGKTSLINAVLSLVCLDAYNSMLYINGMSNTHKVPWERGSWGCTPSKRIQYRSLKCVVQLRTQELLQNSPSPLVFRLGPHLFCYYDKDWYRCRKNNCQKI